MRAMALQLSRLQATQRGENVSPCNADRTRRETTDTMACVAAKVLVNEGIDIFQEWRIADRAAHAAEQRVMRDAISSMDDSGPAPSLEDRAAAHRLRSIANDLFVVAMAELKQRSEQLRR